MSLFESLFQTRDLYLLTGADGSQVHLGFIQERKAVFFFTTPERAKAYMQGHSLKGGLSRVNWKAFDHVRQELMASHVRQAAIDPSAGAEDSALVIPIEQVRLDNPLIWGQPTR